MCVSERYCIVFEYVAGNSLIVCKFIVLPSRKFSKVDVNSEMPSNSEEAAVLWINKCCKTLEKEIRAECSPDEVRIHNLLLLLNCINCQQ